jgi:hypothetical protein
MNVIKPDLWPLVPYLSGGVVLGRLRQIGLPDERVPGHRQLNDVPGSGAQKKSGFGTDVMIILKNFSRKNRRKNWRFLLKKAKFCKFLIMCNICFLRKMPFFSPKIVKNRRKL